MLHQQHRCGVFAAEGGQTAKLLHIVKAQLSQRNGGIKLQADGLGLCGVVCGPCIDGLTEGGQVVLLNFDTGCCRMAAETGQILCAPCQRAVQIKRVRGAAAAASLALMHRNNDDRAAEPLHKARGHDADDTGVPVLTADDKHPVPGAGGVLFQRLQRSGKYLLLSLLTLGVDLRQTVRNAGRLLLVPAEQQLERHGSIIHAARRVQARGQTVAYRIRRDRLSGTAGAFQQGVQAGAHRILQKIQPLPDDGAVFPHQRHDIGYRAERGKLAVHLQKFGRVAALQRGAELKGNTRTAQIFKRAFIVGPLGVHHGNGIGQRIARQMVVSDDKVQPQLSGTGSFLHGRDAVIHRHDQLEALLCQRFKRSAGQAVAGAARGQLAAHMCPLTGETFVQNSRCRNTVHIIVTVDDHEFLIFNSLFDAGDCFVHILEQKRITEPLALPQHCLRSGGLGTAAGGQHPAQQYTAPGTRQRGFGGGIALFQLPRRVIHTV